MSNPYSNIKIIQLEDDYNKHEDDYSESFELIFSGKDVTSMSKIVAVGNENNWDISEGLIEAILSELPDIDLSVEQTYSDYWDCECCGGIEDRKWKLEVNGNDTGTEYFLDGHFGYCSPTGKYVDDGRGNDIPGDGSLWNGDQDKIYLDGFKLLGIDIDATESDYLR